MAVLKLASPWVTYYREVDALFREDPGVQVIYDAENVELKLYVSDAGKAAALTELLPTERAFGSVTMRITVIPGNDMELTGTDVGLWEAAFVGNTAVAYVKNLEIMGLQRTFVVFRNAVVQYFNDALNDIHGVCSTLYQYIADDVFDEEKRCGVFFCTDVDQYEMFCDYA